MEMYTPTRDRTSRRTESKPLVLLGNWAGWRATVICRGGSFRRRAPAGGLRAHERRPKQRCQEESRTSLSTCRRLSTARSTSARKAAASRIGALEQREEFRRGDKRVALLGEGP